MKNSLSQRAGRGRGGSQLANFLPTDAGLAALPATALAVQRP